MTSSGTHRCGNSLTPVRPLPHTEPVSGRAPTDGRTGADGSATRRVLVVDDHRTFTELLGRAIAAEPDLDWVGAAHTVEEAVARTRALAPDAVVMDVQVGDGDGLDATATLLSMVPGLRVVVLTAYATQSLLQRAMDVGACALLPKDGTLEDLLAALRDTDDDGFRVHPALLRRLLELRARTADPDPVRLTAREDEVLHLLADGLDPGAIARGSASRGTPRAGTWRRCSRSSTRTPSSRRSRWPAAGGCSVTPPDPAPDQGRVIVRGAVRRFVLLSVATLGVLAVLTVLVCSRIAQDSALTEAKLRGATLAGTVAAPLVDQRVREQDATAMARLGAVLDRSMEVGSIAHIKLWTPQGRIFWSDERELLGRTFELEEPVAGLFENQGTVAELSHLDKDENATERSEVELVEVYTGTRDADGQALVFETYYTTDEMRARERAILGAILPVGLGGLLLFQAAVMPLAVSLARRVERGELQRNRLLRQTVLTQHRERLRIARDLHDGVVQDLAGLRYALPVVAAHLSQAPEATAARETVEQARDILARDVEALRSLLVDIHPPGWSVPRSGTPSATSPSGPGGPGRTSRRPPGRGRLGG